MKKLCLISFYITAPSVTKDQKKTGTDIVFFSILGYNLLRF